MKTGRRMPVPGVCDACGDSVAWCPHWMRLTTGDELALMNGYLRFDSADVRDTLGGIYVRRSAMHSQRRGK